MRQQVSFFKQALEQVAALPGVDSAGAVSELPLSGAEEVDQFTIEGRPAPANKSDTPLADFRFADGNYFSTMRIPLLGGRYFTEQDTGAAPPVAIISESLARRFFPDGDAVGKRIKGGDVESRDPWATIAGVVGDVKHSSLDAEPRPQLYFPYTQKLWGHMTIVARASIEPEYLANSMRDTIAAIDKDQPVTDMKTLEQFIDESVAKKRFSMVLLTSFAVAALILAAVGIYGVMSYLVSQRKSEMGIRLALGAQSWDIMRLILGEGLKLISIGVTVGLGAAVALTRLLSSLLFGVSATDPMTFAFISLSLVAVALLASFVPARRATKVDPMIALRNE
jgi:putative ABC transport system permease protein